jgi:hypothetical protein
MYIRQILGLDIGKYKNCLGLQAYFEMRWMCEQIIGAHQAARA